ncbi:MAG: polysaccharide biosynthesis/export family protein, partial [Planctomycetota bacterium]
TSDDENIMVQMQDTVIPIDMRDLFEYRNPMANIEMYPGDIISVPRGQLVFIMGQVEKPGAHKLTEGMTALQAISMGGKLAPTHTPRNIKLIRRESNGSTTFSTLDLAKITKGEEDDVEVLPGDIFIVGRSISKTVALQVMKIANTAVGYMSGRVLYDKTAGND